MHSLRTSLNLSNLPLDDQTLLKYLPVLNKMIGLTELEFRNNNLTDFGYQILFNSEAATRITNLDLRENKLSRRTIDALCKNMTHLTTLYISETGIADYELIRISNKLRKL